MSSKKTSTADWIYSNHIQGRDLYTYNPDVNREQAIGRMLAMRLTELSVNRFKWTNLPDSINPRFLELTLFNTGLAIFYYDKNFDKYLVVRGSGMSYTNVFDDPVDFMALTPGKGAINDGNANLRDTITIPAYDPARHSEKSEYEKMKYAIPIWANFLRAPDFEVVQLYATRIATIDRTIEINSKNARRNKVLRSTPNAQLSGVNVARSIDQGDNLIQITAPLGDLVDIEAIDLGIDADSFDKLHILRTRQWTECLELLGINGANQDKKERLVSAEVSANDEQVDSMRFIALNARRHACEQINNVFGLNVSVDFYTKDEEDEEAQEAQENANNANDDDSVDRGDE